MRKFILLGIKRIMFLVFRPFILLYSVFVGNFYLMQKAEWKLNHDYLNVWKTIIVNFSTFTFNVATKMPILVYGRIDFLNVGKIKIDSDEIYTGMLVINPITWRSKSVTCIENHGLWTIKKGGIRIFGGSNIMICKNGHLVLEGNNTIGENAIIYCEQLIRIGFNSNMAYNANITDTNSHYMVNILDGCVGKQRRPVEIGDYNWIGNNTTIKPGTRTPDHITIASSYSVLTKDYRKIIPPYSVLGGCPAKLLKENIARVFSSEEETELLRKDRVGLDLTISKDRILKATITH